MVIGGGGSALFSVGEKRRRWGGWRRRLLNDDPTFSLAGNFEAERKLKWQARDKNISLGSSCGRRRLLLLTLCNAIKSVGAKAELLSEKYCSSSGGGNVDRGDLNVAVDVA